MFVCLFFLVRFFLQGGQQCWALWAFLAACPCTLFIDVIYLFVDWANKDACLLACDKKLAVGHCRRSTGVVNTTDNDC